MMVILAVSENETRRRAFEAFERMREDAAKSGLQGMSLNDTAKTDEDFIDKDDIVF